MPPGAKGGGGLLRGRTGMAYTSRTSTILPKAVHFRIVFLPHFADIGAMKILSVVVLSLLAVGALAAPVIDLKATAAKKTTTRTKNDWGDTDESRSLAINISIRSLRREPETVTVQWLFVAKSEKDKSLWTYSYDGDTITLDGGKAENITATSEKLVAKSYETYFGVHSKPAGWVVVVFQDETIIKCVASTKALQSQCSKWAGFKELLDSRPPEDAGN